MNGFELKKQKLQWSRCKSKMMMMMMIRETTILLLRHCKKKVLQSNAVHITHKHTSNNALLFPALTRINDLQLYRITRFI